MSTVHAPLFHFLQLFTTDLWLYRDQTQILRKYYVVTCIRQSSLFEICHSGHDRIWQKDIICVTLCTVSRKWIVLSSFDLFEGIISWAKKYTWLKCLQIQLSNMQHTALLKRDYCFCCTEQCPCTFFFFETCLYSARRTRKGWTHVWQPKFLKATLSNLPVGHWSLYLPAAYVTALSKPGNNRDNPAQCWGFLRSNIASQGQLKKRVIYAGKSIL